MSKFKFTADRIFTLSELGDMYDSAPSLMFVRSSALDEAERTSSYAYFAYCYGTQDHETAYAIHLAKRTPFIRLKTGETLYWVDKDFVLINYNEYESVRESLRAKGYRDFRL